MNYYISDLHLFHEAQLGRSQSLFDRRPFASIEEMHGVILERWNKKVTNGDTVYILGDVSLKGKNEELIALTARFKGRKVLVKGNHDDVSDLRYRQLFVEICDYKEIKDYIKGRTFHVVLCHYPILMWNGQWKGTLLLYGHTHQTGEDAFFQEALGKLNAFKEARAPGTPPCRAYNVGCMLPYMDYEPRSLAEIMAFAG